MISVKLFNGNAIVEQEMPEICKLSSDNIEFSISNFDELNGKVSLIIENDNLKNCYEIRHKEFNLPISVLTSDITKMKFIVDDKNGTRVYIAPVDRFRVRGVINLKDSDKLVDLLTVLYNKYVELENKYNKLDNLICEGDLLI